MNAVEFLESWYRGCCNGEWEQGRGVTIETLDNPGWLVTIDLMETPLEERTMAPIRLDRSKQDWFECEVQRSQFRGQGDPAKLLAILQIFQDWASRPA